MTCEVRWTAHGEAALEALAGLVAAVRASRPLAPVTVITPSPSVAVSTRRALARHAGGTVGVGFHALGAMAEQLAAPLLAGSGVGVGIDRELVVTAVRVALDERPGRFAPIAEHRVTWERIADAVVEIDPLDTEGLAAVRAAGAVPAEVVRVHGVVRQRLGPLGTDAVVRLATQVATAGGPRVDELGELVVHLPERLSGAELDLLVALGDHLPVRVLAGATGDPALDAATAEQLAPLGALGPAPVDGPTDASEVVSANDVDDEVRAAVRRLLAIADDGVPLTRLALVHPSGPPYARVVADVLHAAGIPFSGPSTRRLAQTAPGRVLLGLLDVDRSRFGRQEVIDLWSTGVVVDGEGKPLPAASFDERTRRLGIIRDRSRWHHALDADDERLRAKSGRARAGEDPPDTEQLQRRLVVNGRLRSALLHLEELSDDLPADWADVAAWAGQVLDGLCGGVSSRVGWPEVELDADAAIRTALSRLSALGELEPAPSPQVVRDTIRTVLETPAPRPGRSGAGLLVTTIDAPPLVPLDGVAVVGLVEGHLPRIGGEDALLGDELRRALGLPAGDDHARRQRRAFLATLASASTHRIVTHPRNDQRSGRALVPSRWLVDLVERTTGTRPDTEALMAGHDVVGVTLVKSHGAGLVDVAEHRTAPLDEDELVLASLVRTGSLEAHPSAADPVLAAGAAALTGRRSRDFTRFDGNLDGDGIDISGLGVLSPTSIETYARCPRRWFFSHALRLRALDRPEEIERIDARERGTLAHAVLESFFAEAIAAGSVPAPGERWSAEARRRLDEITAEACAAAEARGITGHPRRWDHDRAEIQRVLQTTLQGDEALRGTFGVEPVAVELTFGRDGAPPLVVDLGDGRSILLSGQADRVDVAGTPSGSRVVVWDYKYSGTDDFKDIDAEDGDPLGGGTKIQLVAYAMAAAASPDLGLEGDLEVHARYWFLRPPSTNKTHGYVVDQPLRDRFTRVLGALADGIGSGRFPARPGEYQYHRGNFAHCAWCDFDSICPRDRDEEWERVREAPALSAVRGLAEDGSSWVLDEEGLQ